MEKKFKVERRKSRRLVAEEAMLGCASSTPATNQPTSAIGAGPLLVQWQIGKQKFIKVMDRPTC